MSSRRDDKAAAPKKSAAPSAHARKLEAAKQEPLVVLGVIMGSHGLNGDLRVKRFNEDSDLLLTVPALIVRKGPLLEARDVDFARPADRGLYMHLAGVDVVEHSKTLHGAELCLPRTELPPLAAGEFYYTDLDGLAAMTPDGTRVGTVERVFEYPASTVLRVAIEAGIVEVPMREPYLVAVDVAAGRVTVDQLEDLEIEAPRRK